MMRDILPIFELHEFVILACLLVLALVKILTLEGYSELNQTIPSIKVTPPPTNSSKIGLINASQRSQPLEVHRK